MKWLSSKATIKLTKTPNSWIREKETMKKILISIKPKWVAKILNGEKTIEVRKTAPKCELPCEVYIYCSKGKETLAINP